MLDAVVDYLPSPLDVPPMIGLDPQDRRRDHPHARTTASRSARSPSRSPPTRSSASSRSSGSTRARSRPARTSSTRPRASSERIGRILQMHANHREEIDEVYAGDIAAAVGLKDTFTGDTPDRSGPPGHPRVDDLPGAGHRGQDRAEDEGRPGQARRSPSSAWPRRTRPSASRPTRRRPRRSSPAWASSTSTCSSTG